MRRIFLFGAASIAAMALFAACGSTDSGGPSAGADAGAADALASDASSPDAPDAAPFEAGAGVLRIEIQGVPVGVNASVHVVGPHGYSARLATSGQLTGLEPGDYQLHSLAVADGMMGYVPATSDAKITLAAGAGATTVVTYSPLPAVVSPHARPADAATAAAITAIAPSADGSTTTLTFSSPTPFVQGLKADDIVLFGVTTATPHGFMGRVQSVSGNTVVTTPASLSDVLTQGVIAFEHSFAGVNGAQPLKPLDGDGVCVDPSSAVTAADGVLQFELAGRACLAPSISGAFVSGTTLSVGLHLDGTLKLSLDAIASEQLTLSYRRDLAAINLPDILVLAGFVNVVITPVLAFSVRADGIVQAGIRSGVSSTVTVSAGFTIDKNGATSSSSLSSDTSYQWPTFFENGNVTVGVGPNLTLYVNGVGGPSMGIEGYTSFNVDLVNKPLWDLKAGVHLTGGAKFFGGLIDKTTPILDKVYYEVSSNDRPPANLPRFSLPLGTVSAAPAVAGDGTIVAGTGTGAVVALTPDGKTLWTAATSKGGVGYAPIVGPDGSVYVSSYWDYGQPTTGQKNLFAFDSKGALRWSAATDFAGGGAIALDANGRLYAESGALGDSLSAFDSATGAPISGFPVKIGAQIHGAPVVDAANNVYVGTFAGTLVKVLPSGAIGFTQPVASAQLSTPAFSADSSTIFVSAPNSVAAVTLGATPSVKWLKTVSNGARVSAPVVGPGPGNAVYVGTMDGTLVALSPDTGNGLWQKSVPGIVKGAPLVGNDGTIYVGSSGNALTAFAPDGSTLWTRLLAGSNTASLNMDPQGAVLVPMECTATAQNCGLASIFSNSTDLAASWSKESGNRGNAGHR